MATRDPDDGVPAGVPAAGPHDDDSAAARAARSEAPPFLSWPKIYGVVLAVLAAQVGIYAALTHVMR